jgi:hypothetical protein
VDAETRFEIVLSLILMAVYRVGAHKAARIATVVLRSTRPLDLRSLEDGNVLLGADYEGLRKHAEYLVRVINGLADVLVGEVDRGWLVHSFWFGICFLNDFLRGRPCGWNLKFLVDLGWGPVLRPLAARITNLTPSPQPADDLERFRKLNLHPWTKVRCRQ